MRTREARIASSIYPPLLTAGQFERELLSSMPRR
jgi:hypothetical protein